MSNSSLVSVTKISPNKTVPRNHKIDTITIHHMAGNITIEQCLNLFAQPSRQASANYVIGSDGRIGLCVEEKDRAWTSSNRDNDNRAITIEVANDTIGGNWHVSDKAMESLINLLVDICKRNDIKKLLWQDNKALIGQVDKQNMTVHRWFAATACPGEYLMNSMGTIADKVNSKLNPQVTTSNTKVPYLARVTASVLNVRKGAGTNYAVATTVRKNQVYTIVEEKKNGTTPWGKLKSGAGWVCLNYMEKL